MKFIKSHFWYSKSQRNGIFIIVLLILILQSIIFYVDFSSEDVDFLDSIEVSKIHKQIDSLKVIEKARRTPKIDPFNPNYITDYKGYQLGMSLTEIDRLLLFREKNKFINSKREFQKITKVSDSLLAIIAPYFKFPDWVSKVNQQKQRKNKNSSKSNLVSKNKTISTKDINKATKEDLRTVNGIGEKLSERIIKYRSKLQGFSFESQIDEVWGLDKEVAAKVVSIFKIIEKPIIKKVNVNAVTFKELLRNPYVDFELCKKIFSYRDEVAELQDISELKNIKDFPLDKYDRIVLYLNAE